MTYRAASLALLSCAAAFAVLLGCNHEAEHSPFPVPKVEVSLPVQKEVTDYVDFTGRLDAIDSVDVRPRVTGYLWGMPFKEGDEVKTGEVLFEIDPRPYQAAYDRDVGQIKLAEAKLKLAKADYARALEVAKTPGAISQQEVDKYAAQQGVAEADLISAKANAESAKLNLDFCKVTSPINGRISRYLKTIGNLVTQDQTLLTTIVSVDPIYAYFDIDEFTLLKVKRLMEEGKLKADPQGNVPVRMELSDQTDYPYRGTMNFVNNQLDATTGTLQVRGMFANKPVNGTRPFSPGMFCRVRLPIGVPHTALLINDRAVGTDQGQKYVFIVDDKNAVQYRKVVLGQVHDNLRVISEGLQPTDRVVTSGMIKIRSGMTVDPELKPMPTNAGPSMPASPGKEPASTVGASAPISATPSK